MSRGKSGKTKLPELTSQSSNWELQRRAGLASLYFFAKYILGYRWLQDVPHGRLCADLERLTAHLRPGSGIEPPPFPVKKLVLWPRKAGKTIECAIALPLWLSLHNPDIRCLIHSETLTGQSEAILRAIRDIIERNQVFRSLYGEIGSAQLSPKWTNDELILSTRTAVGMREATFTAGAIGTTETGGHFDLIVSDDPVSEKNTTTQEQTDKVLDDHRQLCAMLDRGSVMILDGTPYAYGDLYQYVQENSTGWDISEIHSVDTLGYDSLYTPEYLAAERATQGARRFANWYKMVVVSDETCEFNPDWFETWDGDVEDLPAQSSIFAAFDPAIAEKRDSDRVGLVVLARANRGPCYLLEAKGLQITPTKLIEEIFRVQKQYKPLGLRQIGIEMVGGFKNLDYWLREEEKRRDIYLPRKELKPGTSHEAKLARIRTLAPRYEARQIKHRVGMTDLEDQLLRFPLSNRRDIADALAYAVEMSMKASRQSTVVTEAEAYAMSQKKSKPGELLRLPGNFPKREPSWTTL